MHTPAIKIMKKMFARDRMIDLVNYYQAIRLFSDEQIMRESNFKIPLLMILNTPRCIKVAKGGAAISCTRFGNDSYKG